MTGRQIHARTKAGSRMRPYSAAPPRTGGWLRVTFWQSVCCVAALGAALLWQLRSPLSPTLRQTVLAVVSMQQSPAEMAAIVSAGSSRLATTVSGGWQSLLPSPSAPLKRLGEAIEASVQFSPPSLGQGGGMPFAPDGSLPATVSLVEPFFSAPLYPPVAGWESAPFGPRAHPITGKADFHTGVDLAAPAGTPILAAYAGKIVSVASSPIYGNTVLCDHGGIFTRYCHCETITAAVGDWVTAGEPIATVGSTGLSTGAHLHFELRLGEISVNPAAALPALRHG